MKKTYLKPSTEVVRIGTNTMICTSPGVKSNNGIDYGGIDEEGVKDPASRRHSYDVWDDE